MKLSSAFLFFSLLLFASPCLLGQDSEHVSAELVSEVQSIHPGKPFWVGLHLKMQPNWHTYWKNPGETGLATSLEWFLPEGFTASNIYWPIPEKFEIETQTNYGYSDEVLLLVLITPPETLPQNDPITLKATAFWLECHNLCIPGDAERELTLPVSSLTDPLALNPAWHPKFDKARSQWPISLQEWNISAHQHKERFGLFIEPNHLALDKLLPGLYFFPETEDIIHSSVPQALEATDNGYFLELTLNESYTNPMPPSLKGILYNPQSWLPDVAIHGIVVDTEITNTPPLSAASISTSLLSPQTGIKSYQAIIFAFIGGLILNLMPCVFPILSIKILGFVNHANQNSRKTKLHGITFAIGVLISFWALSALLLTLRAFGEYLGWGFQLQSPIFIIFLIVLLLLLALNFFGVFEIGTSLTSVGGQLAQKQGLAGSFFSGVLATVLATPCTAPFMGSAIAYAITQPSIASFGIFTALALGMAAPYLILSFFPSLLKWLPKPGAWMEKFKQAMAFPLLATVLWLLFTFTQQTNITTLFCLLWGLLLISLAAWIYGHFTTLSAPPLKRFLAQLFSIALLIAGLFLGLENILFTKTEALTWEDFSPEYLEALREEGKPIYIDFTASWCLTCNTNKRVLFKSKKVINALKEKDFVMLKADWTSRDATITQALQTYGRQGIPTNVIYPPSPLSEPIILPEILTPSILLEVLSGI